MQLSPDFATLVQGIPAGLAIAAPVGPIGILCIRRSVTGGLISGVTTGLGAATADLCYALAAGLGLTSLSGWLTSAGPLLHRGGLVFLLSLAISLLAAKPAASTGAESPSAATFTSTFLLTLTNPMTILSFAGLMTALGATRAPFSLAAGVFAGSMLWWLFLAGTAVRLRRWLATPERLVWINRAAGAVLLILTISAAAK